MSHKNKILLSISIFIYVVVNGCSQPNSLITHTVPTTDTPLFTITPSLTSAHISTATPTLVQKLSTPELIEQAYANGEITEEYRLLYLAYALYEFESLPAQFRGNAKWDGTSVVIELYEIETDPSVTCSMSLYVRSELQRILSLDIENCN